MEEEGTSTADAAAEKEESQENEGNQTQEPAVPIKSSGPESKDDSNDGVPMRRGSRELSKRESKRLSKSQSSTQSFKGRRLSQKSKGLPPFPPQITEQGVFVGRDKVINEISNNLKPDTPEQAVKVQVVTGGPGMGKTRLGYDYALKRRLQYTGGVYLFSLETRTTFHNSIRENLAAVELEPSGSAFLDFKRLQSHLMSCSQSLLLYDNANQLKLVEDYIPFGASHTHVLVLTRRMDVHFRKLKDVNVIQLSSLDTPSSVQLLASVSSDGEIKSISNFQEKRSEDYKYASYVVGPRGVGGLPLAVIYMAVIQRSQQKTFEQLWEMLDPRDRFFVQPTILGQWLAKYKLLGFSRKLEDDLGIKTLDSLCSLEPSVISSCDLEANDKLALSVAREDLISFPTIGPWRVLLDMICTDNSTVRNVLVAASLLPSQNIPSTFLLAFAATGQEKYDKALELLISNMLVTVTEIKGTKTVTIHPLVQDAVQQFIIVTESERTDCLSRLSRIVLKLLPAVSEVRKNGRLYESSVKNYSVHLYHLATLIVDVSTMTKEIRDVLDLACTLGVRTRNPGVARPLCDARLRCARSEGNQGLLCIALAEAGRTHSVQRNVDKASKFFSEAREMLEDNPARASLKWWSEAMNELAEGYRDLQQYDKYEEFKGKIRDVLEAAELKNTYYYATALGALGVCKFRQGEPSEAKQASLEALQILREVLIGKHPEIGSELARLGKYCRVMGQYTEAEEHLKEALTVRKSCLPTADPLIAQCLRLLGQLYNDWEKYELAEKVLTVAWSVLNSSNTTNSEEAAIVCRVFGVCRSYQDHAEEGEKQLHQSVGLLTNMYGAEHEETAEALHDLGWCLWHQGQKEKGEQHLRTALAIKTTKYSPEHPSTADTSLVLGQCLVDQSDHVQDKKEEAAALFTTVVDIRNKCLPPNSPKLANSWFELGRCLWLQDVNTQAEAAFRAALNIYNQYTNADTLERAWTLDYLGRSLLYQGRAREAKRALSEALSIRKKKLPANDVTKGWNLYYLSMCHKEDSEPVEAYRLMSEARMILEKTQGFDDEETKMVVDSLLTLRRDKTETRIGGNEKSGRRCTIL